jgi:hypothetical protein
MKAFNPSSIVCSLALKLEDYFLGVQRSAGGHFELLLLLFLVGNLASNY